MGLEQQDRHVVHLVLGNLYWKGIPRGHVSGGTGLTARQWWTQRVEKTVGRC
jgi:hypothetical protein